MKISFWPILALLALPLRADYTPPVRFISPNGYVSPFSLQFRYPEAMRVAGWGVPPWNEVRKWGYPPSRKDWYDFKAYAAKDRPWGPASIQMPAPDGLLRLPASLLVEKLFTAAQQYIGMRYEHHHLPIFNPYDAANYTPPPAWPWLQVGSGYQGPGMDCSSFVSWAYNFALGIKLLGGVVNAAATTTIPGPGGAGTIRVQQISNTGQSYADLVSLLQPGDVLYFHGDKSSNITHSVIWIGKMATDANHLDQYFVLDSTGSGTLDSAGVDIPDGAHLRPFNETGAGSWYYHQFSHAHRIIPLINARPTLAVHTAQQVTTSRTRVRVQGIADSPRGIAWVEYREGKSGRRQFARGTRNWQFSVHSAKAHTALYIRAIGGNGTVSPTEIVRITRTP